MRPIFGRLAGSGKSSVASSVLRFPSRPYCDGCMRPDLPTKSPSESILNCRKKNVKSGGVRRFPRSCAAVRKYKAILYFQDEANISLTALLGKTWAPCGQTPKQTVTGKRGGVSAMSAITSRGQLIFRLHEKRIASEEVIKFLAQMLKHHKRRHLVVVMDQAPPHVSKKTNAFIDSQHRLHVFHLPKYSPDWNPDEKVWNHLKHQELKGHQAKTKAELKALTHRTLRKLSNDPQLLRGIFFRCCVAEVLD